MDDVDVHKRLQKACRRLGWLLLLQVVAAVAGGLGWMSWVAIGDRRMEAAKILPQALVTLAVSGPLAAVCVGVFKQQRWALVTTAIMAGGCGLPASAMALAVSLVYQRGILASMIALLVAMAMVLLSRNALTLANQAAREGVSLASR